METRSNTIADFIETRDAINQLINTPEDYLLVGLMCGSLNTEDKRESPFPVFSFRVTAVFVSTKDATDQDRSHCLDFKNFKAPFGSADPQVVLQAINMINIDPMIQGNSDPALVYISSATSGTMNYRMGRTEYGLQLEVNAVTAEQYDQVNRRPINAESLKDMMGSSIIAEKN